MKAYTNSKTPQDQKNEWRTPPYIFRWVESLLGGIDYDTACTWENKLARPVWAARHAASLSPDALLVDWSDRCFCNCPYDDVQTWAYHAIAQERAITALLIPSPNGESYYRRLTEASHETMIVGRLAFIGADGKPKGGNNRGSSLFIINGYGQGSRSVVRRDDLIKRFG